MPERPNRIRWQPAAGATTQPASPRPGQPAPEHNRPATPLLDALGRDLTALARQGRLPRLFGREAQLRQLQRVLLRKRKNNPLIVGAPGVGKTALVEGLAGCVANGAVAQELQALRIVELPAASLTAGTAVRGTFEQRLQQLVAETAAQPNLLLFIDEIHSLVRAGAVEGGALDAANVLKPALARGELRCVGATTPDEFERFLRADPAFERRFELVLLDEPTESEAIAILAAAVPEYAAHHGLAVAPEALEAAVRLSAQHVPERRLPDKALDLLDAACSYARVPAGGSDRADARITVTADTVAAALAERLGVPVGQVSANLTRRLADLETRLGERVVGQPHAVARVAAAVRAGYGGLQRPGRARLVLAFFGSSGVGKTALAQALAEALFEAPGALAQLDLAEYREPHTLARLWGAPPGYVGYQDEGTFASRLRRQPHCVVLLDEFEKAHSDVHNAFLEMFDAGHFTDARGRLVSTAHAIFVLTSNLFTVPAVRTADEHNQQADNVRSRLAGFIRPELVNRIDEVVLFGPLSAADLAEIARLELERVRAVARERGLSLSWAADVPAWLADRGADPDSGARAVQRLVARQVVEPLAARLGQGGAVKLDIAVDGLRLSEK